MTPTDAAALTRYMRAHFPQQPIDEYTAEALAELLEPYPPADCRTAVLNIADRGEQWCSPSAVKASRRHQGWIRNAGRSGSVHSADEAVR